MNIVVDLSTSIAEYSVFPELFAIVWGHDLMPPYGGYGGEWVKHGY